MARDQNEIIEENGRKWATKIEPAELPQMQEGTVSRSSRKNTVSINLQTGEKKDYEIKPEARTNFPKYRGSETIEVKAEESVIPSYKKDRVQTGFVRLSLPSHCLPYDFREIQIRPFRVRDLEMLSGAVKNNSFTEFLDVLDGTISADIRELTAPDMRFIMYWLRLNSYVKSPYKVPYTSRYGNSCEYIVKQTALSVQELKMTEKEYREYRAKGLDFPRVRDAELLDDNELTDSDRFMLERAQYLEGTDIKAKFELLENSSLELLEDIRDFAEKLTYGVKETAEVTDPNYEPKKAETYLRDAGNKLLALAEASQAVNTGKTNPAANPSDIISTIGIANGLIEEADEIARLLKAGKKPQPREETVNLSLDSLAFFPKI